MGIDFITGVTDHPVYKTVKEAETDWIRIQNELDDPLVKNHPEGARMISWLEIERDACYGYIQKYNGKAPSQNGACPLFRLMETIEKEDIDFLWKDRIPRGKITLFAGDPGIGKSTVASMIAATISRADPLPFDKGYEVPLKSLIISAEDTPADVLRPRLERMRADLSMIAIPEPRIFSAPAEIVQHIGELFAAFEPALIIFDPIIAYTGGRNTDKASQVRDFLTPLSALAEKHRTAVVVILHFSKEKAISALYRVQGSIDWVAVSRSVFGFGQDRDNHERRLFSHIKSSISKLQPTLEYFIDDDGSFRWGIETGETADEVAQQQKASNGSAAKVALEKILENGSMPENEVRDKMEKQGFDRDATWKAKKELQLKATKERETGSWWWRLP